MKTIAGNAQAVMRAAVVWLAALVGVLLALGADGGAPAVVGAQTQPGQACAALGQITPEAPVVSVTDRLGCPLTVTGMRIDCASPRPTAACVVTVTLSGPTAGVVGGVWVMAQDGYLVTSAGGLTSVLADLTCVAQGNACSVAITAAGAVGSQTTLRARFVPTGEYSLRGVQPAEAETVVAF